uniref:Uncharacterized protein n=1 Tax=Arundo donax TaxID=35708 RepID=A0A0A8ZBN4_ARUDO
MSCRTEPTAPEPTKPAGLNASPCT